MSVSRVRCTACRSYVPREEVYFESRLTKTCSEDCFRELHERTRLKSRAKQRSKQVAKKKTNCLDVGLRRKIRSRDGHVCRWCGRVGEQVHHVLYRSQGGPDHASNLILLCVEHHGAVHANKRHWQPILLALLWLGYVEQKWLTVPEVERILIQRGLLKPEAA